MECVTYLLFVVNVKMDHYWGMDENDKIEQLMENGGYTNCALIIFPKLYDNIGFERVIWYSNNISKVKNTTTNLIYTNVYYRR